MFIFKYSPHQYSLFSFLEFLRMAALTKSSLTETKWCFHKQIFKDIVPKNDFIINILLEVWWKIFKNYLKNSCASAKCLFIKFHQKNQGRLKFWKLKEDWKLWSSQQLLSRTFTEMLRAAIHKNASNNKETHDKRKREGKRKEIILKIKFFYFARW